MQKLAENITNENGKTLDDAKGGIIRGLQVYNFFIKSA